MNEVEERMMSNVHWNEEIALSYMEYLLSGNYPDSYQRRNFRKRATDFEVMDRQKYLCDVLDWRSTRAKMVACLQEIPSTS